MPLTIKSDKTDDLKKALKALTRNEVLIGIPDTNAERKPDPGEKTTASNALIGYVQETGSPAKNIPPRPFLVPGVKSVEDRVLSIQKKAGQAILGEKMRAASGEIDKAMNATGLVAQAAVKQKIVSGPFTPLSQRTLDERQARGRTGQSPLIDTGQLLNSVSYLIRPKGL